MIGQGELGAFPDHGPPMPHVGLVIYDPRFGAFVWTLATNSLYSEALKRGIRLSIVPVKSVAEQAAEIERLASKGLDAIIMKPMAADDAAIASALQAAARAGIPVLTLDSPLASDAVICTVGADNASGQRIVAEQVFHRLGGVGKVAYLSGDTRVPSAVLRAEGFDAALAAWPNIELAYRCTLDWVAPISRRQQGADCMRKALAAAPDLRAVIAASDEAALGAMDVVAEHGLRGKVTVAGFDGIPEALLAVRDGSMTWTVRQQPRAIAETVFDLVTQAIAGHPLAKREYVNVELISADNLFETALDSLQMIPGLIHNLAANHELQRQLQQAVISTQQNILQTVAAVSTAVSSIRERDEMLRKVVELIASRFDMLRVSLYIVGGSAGLQRRADHGAQLEAEECSACVDKCFDTLQVQIDMAARAPSAELALPLYAGERAIGVLYLQSAPGKDFDDDKVMVLQGIAHQVSIAIDNANLYDETVRRAKQQEKDQEQLLIAEKMASLGRLTAGIAHEMNTPLAAVRSSLHELHKLVEEYRDSIGDASVNEQDHRDIVKEMEQALALAGSAAEKAAGFVRGVKAQTRDLSAQQLVTFNAVTVIQESVLLLSHALRHGNCTVAFSPSSDVIELHGSPGRLAQVITNLITNAIDASKGQQACEIDVLLSRQGDCIELKVSDRGCGIPAELLPKIFDPMFTTKPFGEGTGLGLTIVHDVVTGDFGGQIRIDSVVGQGTSFVLTLPHLPTS